MSIKKPFQDTVPLSSDRSEYAAALNNIHCVNVNLKDVDGIQTKMSKAQVSEKKPCLSGNLKIVCAWLCVDVKRDAIVPVFPRLMSIHVVTSIAQSEHNLSPIATVEGVAN